jgi:plasmid rolling circle replication initiator protein Rep
MCTQNNISKVTKSEGKKQAHLLDTLEIRSEFFKSKSHENLYRTAVSKHFTLHKIYALVDVCDPEREKQYWKSYHCANVVIQEGTKLSTGLCRKRWCNVCQRKKTAELLNGYSSALKELHEEAPLFMVTLTAKNIKATSPKALRDEIRLYNKEFSRIKDNIRKTHSMTLNGFKKVECTYNQNTNEYHPHLHLIIQGKAEAELIKAYWLIQMKKRYGRNKVGHKGQEVKPIGNTEKDYIEVFKYATKGSVKDTFEASAEDLMIEALEGLQIFKPIGKLKKVKAPKEEAHEQTKADFIEELNEIYFYDRFERDYISASNERLIGTQAINELIQIKVEINAKHQANEEQRKVKSGTSSIQP